MAKLMSTEEFTKRIDKRHPGKYTIKGEYQGNGVKVLIQYNECGHEKEIAPQSIRKGTGCQICTLREASKRMTKTQEEFEREVEELFEGEYSVIGKFKTMNHKVKIRHNTCGTEYDVRADSLTGGSKCKKCIYERYSKEYKKTTEEYQKEVYESTRGDYLLESEYRGVKEYVTLKHSICGLSYKVYPYMFKRGRRCPNCNHSKGEEITKNVLEDLGVTYEYQVMFEDLKNVNHLIFDFYLPEQDILIEYQGKQHYEPVELFGGEETFIRQVHNDSIKRKYSEENLYYLVEIPYTIDTYEGIRELLERIVT